MRQKVAAMSITKIDDFREKAVIDVAEKMILTEKIAPKGCGIERLEYVIVTENDILPIATALSFQ
jgi:uncharacterized ferredoxin-like protein